MNYEDIKKGKIYKHFKRTEQLNEGTLFKNVDIIKRYYDDINEGEIDGTEEIKQLLNKEYLLKNDDDNNEKCCA